MLSRLTAFVLVVHAAGQTVTEQACINVSSGGRLVSGASFSAALGGGLEFRLLPVRHVDRESNGWTIVVGPAGHIAQDFLWVVSPPFQAAPHLMIADGYGTTPEESVQTERHLRFVLNREDYGNALHIVQTQAAGPEKVARQLEPLAKGSLRLRVTAHGIREATRTSEIDRLDWIEFEGRVCTAR